jgi:O-antigen ligase
LYTRAVFDALRESNDPTARSLPSKRLQGARALALLALWSIPLSTALTNVLGTLFIAWMLVTPETYRSWRAAARTPAIPAAMALALALTASLLYTVAPLPEATDLLLKYRKLLLLPLAWIAFRGAFNASVLGHRGLFWITVGITLCSTTNFLEWTSIGPLSSVEHPSWVTKNRIAAGVIGVWCAYYGVHAAWRARSAAARWGYGLAAALIAANVLFMLEGRTAQVILLMLLPACVWQMLRGSGSTKRTAIAMGMLCAVLICGAIGAMSALSAIRSGNDGGRTDSSSMRFLAVTDEVTDYRRHNAITSTGLRLEWYRKALSVIAERPWIGYGVGSVRVAFEPVTAGRVGAAGQMTRNPHNEFLLMGVQMGLPGIGLFVVFLIQLARSARQAPAFERNALWAWLAIFAFGSLANSFLLDFTEGHVLTLLCGIVLGGTAGRRHDAAPLGVRPPSP